MVIFLLDAPLRKVIKVIESLGFHLVREGNHTAMVQENATGSQSSWCKL